eukprot:2169790-Prymnesium_polylepis.1
MDAFDAFDVFDAPTADDPFDVFDAPQPSDAPCGSSAKRPRPAASVIPLVQQFAREHAGRACSDLQETGATTVGAALAAATDCLLREPPDLSGCRTHAEHVDSLAWQALQEGGWAHVCWREAYVLAQLVLCCVDAERDAERDAVRSPHQAPAGARAHHPHDRCPRCQQLRRCDRAFIL